MFCRFPRCCATDDPGTWRPQRCTNCRNKGGKHADVSRILRRPVEPYCVAASVGLSSCRTLQSNRVQLTLSVNCFVVRVAIGSAASHSAEATGGRDMFTTTCWTRQDRRHSFISPRSPVLLPSHPDRQWNDSFPLSVPVDALCGLPSERFPCAMVVR